MRNKNSKKPDQGASVEIDWDKVDRYLQAGCTQKIIANSVGMSPNGLREKCFKEKGIDWAEYSSRQRDHGDALLYLKVFDAALKGNTQILLRLAAVRLGLLETDIKTESPHQDVITLDHDRMQLQHKIDQMEEKISSVMKENAELKEILKRKNDRETENTTTDYEQETEPELLRSNSQVQHLGGGGEQWKDTLESGETDLRSQDRTSWGRDDHRSEPYFHSAEHFDSPL